MLLASTVVLYDDRPMIDHTFARDNRIHDVLRNIVCTTVTVVPSLGDDPEMARELEIRELFALEEHLGDSRARTKCDLRSGEVARAERQAHRALQIDVQVLPALSYVERKEGMVAADVGNAPSIANARARRGWRWWGFTWVRLARYLDSVSGMQMSWCGRCA